jgi:1-acyl-sn-glycerol-3-phosphate acyltransferase
MMVNMGHPKPARRHSCGPLPERLLRTAFHWVVITGCRILYTITCRVRVVELAPVPRKGALIMASNHISHFDPPILSGFFPRRLDWMAMGELFGTPFWRGVFTRLNCIPVERGGGDRTSLRTALHRLEEGRVIGIFPEGGIRAGEYSILNGAPMKPGLAALSIMSGAPIIPCVLLGSDRLYKPDNWLRRIPIFLLIGDAIEPPKEDARQPGARERFAYDLSKAFVTLKEEAVSRFGLKEEELPQTPQARKGIHP